MKPNKPVLQEELSALVQALSQGDVEAYSRIYRIYYPRLYRYALQLAYQPELAEDVLQDFFTYLAENCYKLRKVSNFEVYLFQSVKRNMFSRLSREQRSLRSRERYHQRVSPNEDQVTAPADELIIARETLAYRQQLVRGALADLPDHQREVLYLRYYEEMSYREICQILDLNNQVARNYVSRAIKQLKTVLFNKELLLSVIIWYC